MVWGNPEQILIDFNWILIENERGKWSEAAQSRFWLIFNWILIENEREMVWGSPEQILIDI